MGADIKTTNTTNIRTGKTSKPATEREAGTELPVSSKLDGVLPPAASEEVATARRENSFLTGNFNEKDTETVALSALKEMLENT